MKKHFKIYRSSLQNKNLNFLNKRIKKRKKNFKMRIMGSMMKKIMKMRMKQKRITAKKVVIIK